LINKAVITLWIYKPYFIPEVSLFLHTFHPANSEFFTKGRTVSYKDIVFSEQRSLLYD